MYKKNIVVLVIVYVANSLCKDTIYRCSITCLSKIQNTSYTIKGYHVYEG